LYECTLQGEGFHFIQKRSVGTDMIKSAPNVRVQQALWVKCKEGEKEPVICCVQSPYNVRWYDGSKLLSSALSLLIADICFFIWASIAKNPKDNPNKDYIVPIGPCSAATFFMHFFYLAMFFWMFVSSLLLLYRTVMVFSQMSKWTMLTIGLTVGYVCPLIIAVTTVAATAPDNGYVRQDQACWLNWMKTKALLALVIPALTIVVFNILVIIVVLYKMLTRRGTGNTVQADEKHALAVILRCVAILTPLFGLTWSLGIGTMVEPKNKRIHIAFAFFNSLQVFALH
ncbi:hypothetical protein GOODEAATRI_010555, partial [Goodea atripinnis]